MNFRAPPKHDGAGHRARRSPRAPAKSGVLSIKPFRRLWIALSLSSLGDWLSILALTVLAAELTGKHTAGQSTAGAMATQSAAVAGVWLATLLPALLLGPLAGAIADRLDRRMTMIIGDVVRGLLFLSIPLFPNLIWIYIAKFLAGCASLFWNPATAASIPNLVPKDKLERANQLSLLTTYGTAPVAAGLFSVLALVSEALGRISPYFKTNNVDLALYINAASYAVSALTIFIIRQIPKRQHSDKISVPSAAKSIWEGWRLIGKTPVLRGLSLGMVGAFTGAGVVVGLGYSYITYTLHGGSAGWGLVFAALFVGLAAGMVPASRLLKDFSRRRLFGIAIVGAAVPLALIGLIPNLIIVILLVVVIGALAGVAYATGFTIVGLEVDDDTRGRTFAFFQSSTLIILFVVIAAAGFLSTGFTKLISGLTGSGNVTVGHVVYASAGQNVVLLLGALVAAACGIIAYRYMDDRKGVPLREDLVAAIRGEPLAPEPAEADEAGAADGSLPARAPRAVHRAGGRRGRRQDDAGADALDLAARAGLRRRHHPRARRDQGRHAAARAAAGHRARRDVAAGRGPDVRRRPGRARGLGDQPGPGARRGRHHRPLHRLLARLPGRRAGPAQRGRRLAEPLGHRRPDART